MDDLERNIREGYAVCRELRSIAKGVKFGSGLRNALLCGYLDLALEHQRSVLVLTEARLYGSAFTLVRPLFEATIRGLWIKACAVDSQVKKVEGGASHAFPSVGKMVEAVEREREYRLVLPGKTKGFFAKRWDDSNDAMHDYAHGAIRAVSRRFDGCVVEPKYADEEIIEVNRFCTTTILILARCFFAVMSCRKKVDEVQQLMDLYFKKVGLR